MRIIEIWRYPVKTMAGEKLTHAQIGLLGIKYDRVIHVENSRGGIITSRTHPRFLSHQGSIDAEGRVTVDGRRWNNPSIAAIVEQIGGPGAKLVQFECPERFDVLPLLVATDGAISAFGYDGRRLRPNIVIGGVEGMSERAWEGSTLRIGEVLIGARDLRLRCIMTSFDPDTQVQNTEITKSIYSRFEGKLALNCFVIQGGEISVGDFVELL